MPHHQSYSNFARRTNLTGLISGDQRHGVQARRGGRAQESHRLPPGSVQLPVRPHPDRDQGQLFVVCNIWGRGLKFGILEEFQCFRNVTEISEF